MVLMIAAEGGPKGGPSMPVPVHRDILVIVSFYLLGMSRSPIFKAMLVNEMEESRSDTIKISDMSYDALHAFVNFLHAEACVNEQMACELLVSAEKYQVEQLKAYCEKFLVSKLNWDNSIKYYAFAHQHNAKHLLEAATSLISDNLDKLRKRQEYPLLVEEDPCLGLELLKACLVRWENNAALDTSAK
ncbi:BTB/POZ domain-containing protein At4g08455 [Eucalyptus grandis]|nr:BTB/POZ domain-containing protein At4g08455 [Eucalyptus grandis]